MHRNRLLLALACGLFLVLGFGLFGSTGRDDVYITYWPAHTLARQGKVLNYNGEAVEQSSSLLFVVVLGAIGWMSGLEPHQFGLAVSVCFGLAGVLLTYLLALRVRPERAGVAACLAALMVPLLYWSYSGMETSLVACLAVLLVLGMDSCLEGKWTLALLTIPMWLLVRPEAPFTFAVFGFTAAVLAKREWRKMAYLLAYGAAVALVIAGFRIWHFGTWLPQPAMVKGGAKLMDGVRYLERNWPMVVMVLPCFALLRGNRAAKLASSMAGTLLLFVLVAGGDWMEGGRFLAPLVPLAATGLACLPVRRLWLAGFAAANLAWVVEFALNSSTGTPLWAVRETPGYGYFVSASRLRSMDAVAVERGDRLVGALPTTARTFYSNQMGMVVYYLSLRYPGRLRVLDRAALVERSFSTCPATSGYPHGQNGLQLPFGIPLVATDLARCGIPRPDVVYDIRPEFQEAAVSAGYGVLAVVEAVPYDAGVFKGGAPPRHHFFAVRVSGVRR